MKILIITPYFKPYENPRAYRWTQVAMHLQKGGHEVHVLTSDDHKLGDETNGLSIHRISYSTPDKAFFQNKSATRGAWIPDFVKSRIKRHIWPDESKTWIRPAFQLGTQVCSDHQIEMIISVSMPFSSHCIAHQLKQKFSLPWLADIGDPFEIGKQHNFSKKRSEQEKNILSQSNAISVTTQSLADVYTTSLSHHQNHVYLIGPMSSPMMDVPPVRRSRQKDAPIKLGYFGTFYRNVREPYPLIQGVNLLAQELKKQNLELHTFGDIKAQFLNRIHSQINCTNVRLIAHPNVPRSNVIQTMQNLDALISVGNKNPNQIPSKVVDYVLSRRPIIHFSTTIEDRVSDYLQSNPLYIPFNSADVSAISQRLIELIDSQDSAAHDHYLKVKNESQPSSVALKYLHIVESMTPNFNKN